LLEALPAEPGDTQLISAAAPVAVKRSPAGPAAGRREAGRLTGAGRLRYATPARSPMVWPG
jgi:hypothetical protein